MSIQIPARVSDAFCLKVPERFRIAFEEIQSNMQAQPDIAKGAVGVYAIHISTSDGTVEKWGLDLTEPPGRVFAASVSGGGAKPSCTLSLKEEYFL
jgi:hypothetical protein